MDMDQAAVWLGGSILVMLGFIVVVAGLVVINNLLYNYWKPVTFFSKDSFSMFGMNHGSNSALNLTDDEYNKLVEHLEIIRKEESNTNGKSQ